MSKYLYNIGLALSILLNAILGGETYQSFSARNYQRKREGKANLCIVIDALTGKDHCIVCWSYWIIKKIK